MIRRQINVYIRQVLPAARSGLIKAMSHITGGGFTENIPRVLPSGLGCFLDAERWDLPEVFKFLVKHGGVEPLEMARTFNNGIGMVLVVARADVGKAREVLERDGEKVY